VTGDIVERQQLNTPVSAMMELVNDLYAYSEQTPAGSPGGRPTGQVAVGGETAAVVREALEAVVRLLAPFAPHTCEELWVHLGHSAGLNAATWPTFDAAVAKADEVVIPVQVNGKIRARLTLAADTPDHEVERLALNDPLVLSHTAGKTVAKVVVASGRLVSIAVR
jgi:leucyl-tRNA synthetase